MVTLKLAKPENAKELGTLFHECFMTYHNCETEGYTLEECTAYFSNRRCCDTVIGIYDGNIIGFCTFGKAEDEYFRDAGSIEYIMVKKEYQRLGDGRRILHEAVRQLRRQEYSRAMCWIDRENEDAISFFKALGFIFTGEARENRELTLDKYFRTI